MNLKITTKVKADLKKVKDGFDESLFKALNPPFPKVKLLQFDGCLKGDIVHLELNFLLFKQSWKSEIIEDHSQEGSFYFIDVGVFTPFFLKSWRHKHIINQTDSGSEIVDDITYSTGTLLTDILMYPVMLGQFAYRKPVYKRIFKV